MKYQFCIRFSDKDANSAASKAVVDCNQVLFNLGYTDYTFTVANNANKLRYYCLLLKELVVFFAAIKKNAIIAIQYPLLSINSIFKLFIKVARYKKLRFFCIIHDLESLRTGGNDEQAIQKEIANLAAFDALIVHNDAMKQWLAERGIVQPMISLTLFDYLSAFQLTESQIKPVQTLAYAGNLAKSKFIYQLDQIQHFTFNVYGPNYQKDLAPSSVKWMGEFSPAKIVEVLNGAFGLIWDGNEIEKCDEILGNYLKYNNPHKASLYIAAGIPLMAPTNSAIGKLVKELNIGVLITSLKELSDFAIPLADYEVMKENIRLLRLKVINGGFLKEAVITTERILHAK